ncbi:hypothetical protein PN441_15555 [Spirulina major CS-329]|uniref:hypothetical protein n=1 Tax=Spirulina TaxID=1154 RepID=UPI00232C712E|nr:MULTISPECIES: hypothetical protein [Spirulina]MDB9493314.1 hypothetical protein [Spirulina subsalsa CS-330]MDB9504492.1 hypothetical protein [Spirulina major CS-329]
MIPDPDIVNVTLSFPYRGYMIQLAPGTWQGVRIYTAWVAYDWGDAIAVPKAWTREEAVRRARLWIDRRRSLGVFPPQANP